MNGNVLSDIGFKFVELSYFLDMYRNLKQTHAILAFLFKTALEKHYVMIFKVREFYMSNKLHKNIYVGLSSLILGHGSQEVNL